MALRPFLLRRIHLLAVPFAVAFTAAAPAASPPLTHVYAQIKTPTIKQQLQAYQQEGWSRVFTRLAKGQTAASFIDSGNGRIARLKATIKNERVLLKRSPSGGFTATPASCLTPRTKYARIACDIQTKTDEIAAISAILAVARTQFPAIALPYATFGTIRGAAIATSTVTVVPKFAALSPTVLHPGAGARRTGVTFATVSPNVHSLVVVQGQTIVIDSAFSAQAVASGFSVQPAGTVLRTTPGLVHINGHRFAYLIAAAPGTATIRYYGPTIREATCGGTSSNWSGYGIVGGPFAAITATWIVPTVSSSSSQGNSSTWAGIDGCANEPQLIQTGTEQDMGGFLGLPGASYSAWWEVLPQFMSSQSIDQPVFPGDRMTATISSNQAAVPNVSAPWTMTLTDVTQGWTQNVVQSFDAPLDQAEWVEEAPTSCFLGGCGVSALTNYQSVTFDNSGTLTDSITVGSSSPASPGLIPGDRIVLNAGGNDFSTPSLPDCDADGFTAVPGLIGPAPPGPMISSFALPTAVFGNAYSQSVPLSGGPVTWTPASATLAPGILFNNGSVSGTPTSAGAFTLPVRATDASQSAMSCSGPLSLVVQSGPTPQPTAAPPTFNTIRITIFTGNDDLRDNSDLQVNFAGITGWPGTICLVQGNSHNHVGGSACSGGSPGDWASGPVNSWNGWSAWSTNVESRTIPGMAFTGSGSMTFTFTTHGTGCENIGGCGTSNDNWDIQAMRVDLISPTSTTTLLNVGNFGAAHNSGTCFWRLRPPGGTDPSTISQTWTFPPNPGGNGCPND